MNISKLCSGEAGIDVGHGIQYVYRLDNPYLIVSNATGVFVCNLITGDIIIDEAIDTGFIGSSIRLWHVKERSSSLVLRVLGIKSGSLVIDDVDIDLGAKIVNISEYASYSLSWASTWEEVSHSQIIGDVWFSCDWDGDYHVHAVNLLTGEDVDLGTFGLSNPIRVSSKVMLRTSTSLKLLMIIGQLVSGSSFYVVDLIGGSQVKTLENAGSASPRPQIGAVSLLDKIYIPLANSGANDSINYVDIYDDGLNKLGRIDFSSYISNPNDWGFALLAKLSDGKLVFMGNVVNNSTNNIDNYVVGKLNSDFTIDSLQVIRSVDRTQYGGHGEGSNNAMGSYDDKTMIPVADYIRKRFYFLIEDADPNGNGFYPTVYVIDISDEDIDTLNRYVIDVNTRILSDISLSINNL